METCKTCKYWKAWDHRLVYVDPRDWSAKDMCEPLNCETLEFISQGFKVKVCAHPQRSIDSLLKGPKCFGLSICKEYGHETAYLVTGEDFGCVLHENGTE